MPIAFIVPANVLRNTGSAMITLPMCAPAMLKVFVVAVIIQSETGGNLAEILKNTAHLIRERESVPELFRLERLLPG